jgi:WD40 repeat protein
MADFFGDQPPTYSSDGSLLVYPAGAYLVVRDARTLSLLTKLPLEPLFTQEVTADIPDGSILIAPDRRTVYYAYWILNAAGRPTAAYLDRWSLPSGRRLPTTRIGPDALFALRLVDSGSRLVVVAARGVSVYDAHSLALVRSDAILPTPASPSAAAISPDGRTIAIGSRTGSVSFVDLSTGDAHRGVGGQGGAVAAVVYSPNGASVVSIGDDNQVTVWDPRTNTPVTVLTGPLGQVQNAAVSPDGSTLYTASLDGVVLAWDLTGNRRFGRRSGLGPRLGCCGPVSPRAPPLALSPDGAKLAVRLGASTVGVFSAQTLQRQAWFTIRPRGDAITALAWSPTGSRLAVAGHSGVVQLWALDRAPRLVRSLSGLRSLAGLPEAIQALAFSPDGKLVAASDDSETRSVRDTAALPLALLAVWRTGTGTLIAPPRDLGVGNGPGGSDVLAFSRDGKLLAVSLLHGGVLVLDASTAQMRRKLSYPGDDTISLAFAPDGMLATGTLAGIVELWNPNTGARLAPPLLAASAPVTGVAFDPTGRRLATTGYHEGTVKLWFTSTLQEEGPALNTDPGATSTAAFEPAGRGLVAIDDYGNGFTWPTSLAAWEHHACAVAARNLSRQEWARFVAEPRYATVCP